MMNNSLNIKSDKRSYLISVFLFIFISLLGVVSSQTMSGPAEKFKEVWSSSDFPWEAIALVAVLITFSFSALAYMLSKLFSSGDLEKLAKYEFLYALSSVVLIVFIIAVVDVLALKSGQFVYLISTSLSDNNFNQALRNQIELSGYSPFSVANFYIVSTLNLAIVRYKEAFCVGFPLFAVSSFFNSIPLNLTLTTLQNSMSNLSYMIYLFYFQKHLLAFIQATMLTVFLPIGIVLRGFPFVRSIGNFLIAIAIGLYFVYPLTYSLFLVIGSQGTSQVGVILSQYNMNDGLDCIQPLLSDLSKLSFNFVKTLFLAPLSENVSLANEINNLINTLIGEIVLFGFVFPFLAAVITYTFIKSFGIVLNADLQEFAEGLVKLI